MKYAPGIRLYPHEAGMRNRTAGSDTPRGMICSDPGGGGRLITCQATDKGSIVGVCRGVAGTYPGGGPGLCPVAVGEGVTVGVRVEGICCEGRSVRAGATRLVGVAEGDRVCPLNVGVILS